MQQKKNDHIYFHNQGLKWVRCAHLLNYQPIQLLQFKVKRMQHILLVLHIVLLATPEGPAFRFLFCICCSYVRVLTGVRVVSCQHLHISHCFIFILCFLSFNPRTGCLISSESPPLFVMVFAAAGISGEVRALCFSDISWSTFRLSAHS